MENNPIRPPEDDLVAKHRKARSKKKRKITIIAVTAAVVILAVLIIGIQVLRSRVAEEFASAQEDAVQNYSVTTGSISTTVSGSGTLSAEDVETVDIASTLEILDVYAEAGQTVQQGDLLATVTKASLTAALADAQAALDELDEALQDAEADSASSYVRSSISGRVKQINVEAGDDVATAMYDHGALMVLSLDGFLAADVETDALAAGDAVTVVLSDGTEVSGTAEKVLDGIATVLVTDQSTPNGDTVTIKNADGSELGSAALYIHSPMAITGYAGTVSYVNVKEDQQIYNGSLLLRLKDTATSANYDALLKERAELEADLNELLVIYKEGGITAPISGRIESITETAGEGFASISPEKTMTVTISVDETNILSLSEGQAAAVTIDSVGEEKFRGTVTEISTIATSSSGVSVYSAVITLDKADGMLSGMSADVVITIEGVDNALLIPVDALHQTRATAYVYTAYNAETGEYSGMVEVTTGLQNSNYVEITSGLKEGDTVYYTEEEESGFSGMGGMSFGGGSMPEGFSGGGFSGDSMPGGNGGFSGGMPGGNTSGGSRPDRNGG